MNATNEVYGQLVRLSGRLDGSGAPVAREALRDALEHGDADLVVDVSAVETVDVTGLGVLVAAHRRAGHLGRRLVLRDVPPRLARVLVITRLGRILPMERTPVAVG
jgi:anti-anti-sigma factor